MLCHLVTRVENRARAELSARLAPIDYAPFDVVQHLARDDEIAVAGRVLATSSRLRTSDLVEIASTKGQDHLLAISGRTNLPEAVTDVIVDRGERKVIHRLANNASARFSDTGYSKIVARSEADAELIEILGLRVDLPLKFLRDLLERATDAVRDRLMALAPPELKEEISRVLKAISAAAQENARDFSRAETLVKRLKDANELNDDAIIRFAETKQFDEVSASLAILGGVPTEMMARLLEGPRSSLQIGWIELGDRREHTMQSPIQTKNRRSNTEGCSEGLRPTFAGDRPAHAALLAGPRQARKVEVSKRPSLVATNGSADGTERTCRPLLSDVPALDKARC